MHTKCIPQQDARSVGLLDQLKVFAVRGEDVLVQPARLSLIAIEKLACKMRKEKRESREEQ
jgi:hypothetical protein